MDTPNNPWHFSRGQRWALGAALAATLALGVWGYQSPAIALAWETLVALCGF